MDFFSLDYCLQKNNIFKKILRKKIVQQMPRHQKKICDNNLTTTGKILSHVSV